MYLDVSEDNSLKEKILRAITRKLHLEEGLDLSDVALRCPSHATGADLYALCSSATICALRREIQRLEDEGRIDKLVYSRGHKNGNVAVPFRNARSTFAILSPALYVHDRPTRL